MHGLDSTISFGWTFPHLKLLSYGLNKKNNDLSQILSQSWFVVNVFELIT